MEQTPVEHDALLMLRAKQGDMEAMDELALKYRPLLLRYFYRRVGDYSAAEDLAQDVLLRVFRHRDRYEPTAKFSTWLYPIASHLASNWIRDHRRERHYERLDERTPGCRPREYPDGHPDAEERLLDQARLNGVRRAVDALPPRQRNVVVMHKFLGIGCPQIASSMECTPQAVRSLLVRAYAGLRVFILQFES